VNKKKEKVRVVMPKKLQAKLMQT